MARLLATSVAILVLAGCDLGGGSPERHVATSSRATSTASVPTPLGPPPSRTGLVVQAIRACEVKQIAHDDTMWITYRGGRTVPMKGLNPWAIQRATERPDACNVLIGIE